MIAVLALFLACGGAPGGGSEEAARGGAATPPAEAGSAEAGSAEAARDAAPPASIDEALARTRALAKRLHAVRRATRLAGTLLARGPASLPPVLERWKVLFAGDLDPVRFSLAEAGARADLVAEDGDRRWVLELPAGARYLDPHLVGFLNRVLTDLGSGRRVARTLDLDEDPYLVVASAEALTEWTAQGLLLDEGPAVWPVPGGPRERRFASRPRPVDLAVPGWSDADLAAFAAGLRAVRRLQVPGFGAFAGGDSPTFRPDQDLLDRVAAGEPREAPYRVRAPLGELPPERLDAAFRAITAGIVSAGAVRLPDGCAFTLVDRPRRLVRDPRTGEVREEPAAVDVAYACPGG